MHSYSNNSSQNLKMYVYFTSSFSRKHKELNLNPILSCVTRYGRLPQNPRLPKTLNPNPILPQNLKIQVH